MVKEDGRGHPSPTSGASNADQICVQYMVRLTTAAVFCVVTALIQGGWADEDEQPIQAFPSLQMHGFGTVGVAQSDRVHLVEQRDLQDVHGVKRGGNPLLADSRLGLQADALIDPTWSATVQLVFKDRPVQSVHSTLQWAFVKFQPLPALQLRAGRMGADSFMLSDQRNVGFTYLWVRPPIEFYGTLPVYSYDGADIQYRWPQVMGSLEAKVFYGRTIPDIAASPGFPEKSFELKVDPVLGANLGWHVDESWLTRLSYVYGKIDSSFPGLDTVMSLLRSVTVSYPPAALTSADLTMQGSTFRFLSLGGAFDGEEWRMLGEISHIDFSSHFKPNVYASYLSVGRAIGAWTPYVDVARIWPARKTYFAQAEGAPPGLPQSLLTAINQQIFAADQANQATWSLGVRWDFYNNFDMKFQYDRTHVYGPAYNLWTTDGASAPLQGSDVNAVSFTLDAVF